MGREEHCNQLSLVCVGTTHSIWTTLGLPQLTAHVLSWSTLLRLIVTLQGNCPNQTQDFAQFPGLSCSGSGSRVLHKGTDLVGHVFCALPRSEKLRQPGTLGVHCPRWSVHLHHLPGPVRLVSWVHHKSAISGMPCVSSGELISGCDPPGRCQLSRIPGRLGYQLGACSQFGEGCHVWGRDCSLPSGSCCCCCMPAFLPPVAWEGPICSRLVLLWYSLNPLFCEQARLCLRLEPFVGNSCPPPPPFSG